MKTILASVFVFLSSVATFACEDFSGVYELMNSPSASLTMTYEIKQNACDSFNWQTITIQNGVQTESSGKTYTDGIFRSEDNQFTYGDFAGTGIVALHHEENHIIGAAVFRDSSKPDWISLKWDEYLDSEKNLIFNTKMFDKDGKLLDDHTSKYKRIQ